MGPVDSRPRPEAQIAADLPARSPDFPKNGDCPSGAGDAVAEFPAAQTLSPQALATNPRAIQQKPLDIGC